MTSPIESIQFKSVHKNLSPTILVSAGIYNELTGDLEKTITLNCLSGALIVNGGKYFDSILSSDGDCKTIDLPKTFSYKKLWENDLQTGIMTISEFDIINFFALIHRTENLFTSLKYWKLYHMAHYIECQHLMDMATRAINGTLRQELVFVNLAFSSIYECKEVEKQCFGMINSTPLIYVHKNLNENSPYLKACNKSILIQLIKINR